ncbi:cellulose binding domain-containing protein [Streptomyces sp. NPDC059477]|uniref:cellulose binding domain-containing protein n=1 Tax=Streptomyces sp. NPDC059477 TaxID=3346847 RepID=UPI0036827D1E
MPDLPLPQNATEAAEFDESWDAVLSYADLCTGGSDAAVELATEAFAHGIREARTGGGAHDAGRCPAALPRIPLLLCAVRDTAADWERRGQGHRLDPELRLWLTSGQAVRHTAGTPAQRPLALRGLQDMQRPDAALLWLTEVEAQPLPVVAARLGLDPAGIAEERTEVRALFRDRSLRNHLDRPMDPQCRGYARMLDAVTRTAVANTPDDLSRHLARCAHCAEAAACLRVQGGGLPAALAGGVLGWGGLAYLERRRRAAEVRLAAGQAASAGARRTPDPRRIGVLRGGLLAGAVLVSVIALGVSLMPFGGARSDAAAQGDALDRVPIADPDATEPDGSPQPSEPTDPAGPTDLSDLSDPSETPRPSQSPPPTAAATPTPAASTAPPAHHDPDPEPQGTSTSTATAAPGGTGGVEASPESGCRVTYDVTSEWSTGFEATVEISTEHALDDWTVGWSFRDGQRISTMWDARPVQDGPRVTARAAHYNRAVPAGGSLAFGFVALLDDGNAPAHDFTLNGRECVTR